MDVKNNDAKLLYNVLRMINNDYNNNADPSLSNTEKLVAAVSCAKVQYADNEYVRAHLEHMLSHEYQEYIEDKYNSNEFWEDEDLTYYMWYDMLHEAKNEE